MRNNLALSFAAGRGLGVQSRHLLWAIGALFIAYLPHITALPYWIPLATGGCALLRIAIEFYVWRLPPRWLLALLTLASFVGVVATFRAINGLDAGTGLLAIMAGVKLLETRDARDHAIVVMIGYVMLFSTLLYNQSLLRAPYVVLATWALTATLLRVHQSSIAEPPRAALRAAGVMLLQALPMAALLFVFFPRLSGQFWALPARGAAATGLSDEMTPGDIATLTLSGAPAFRVTFDGALPPPIERYWRGPVLHNFDGRTWRQDRLRAFPPQELIPRGPTYRYRMTFEPTQRDWIVALDAPTQWPRNRMTRWYDMQLIARRPLSTLISYELESHSSFDVRSDLSFSQRLAETALPAEANPRTRALALRLREQAGDDSAFIQAVLAKFHDEKFFYTLQPPALGEDSVDEFLFDTRRGFCEHFASAFTVLARAAGIPARIVTGYQGGEFNELGDYLLIRQSDAHAWSEVWLQGRGWTRVDPTAAVAPERVERNLSAALGENEPVPGRFVQGFAMLARVRLMWDAVNNFWNNRIVEYDELKQKSLLAWLGIRDADWRHLGAGLAITLLVFLLAIGAYVAALFRPKSRDPIARIYDALCRKLARRRIPRAAHEGPKDYLARVAAAKPALAAQLHAISALYLSLRYGPQCDHNDLKKMRAMVKAL